MRCCIRSLAATLIALIGGNRLSSLHADEASAPAVAFFERNIRPVLVERCYKCHSAHAKKLKGGLHLDTRDGILEGGETGPAVVPGKPAQSLLIQAIRHQDGVPQMPPTGAKLPDETITDFEKWIAQGAVRPDDREATQTSRVASTHWSFQPVRRPAAPAVKNRAWLRNEIDAIVLARLEKEGIAPSPEADRTTLIRRLYLDLTGLPPTPSELDAALGENSPDGYERLVDRLLRSPHFGERWAKHWLDLARYADSDGYEMDNPRPYAWRWRDWVIEAVNRDLPFDQFTIQQLAGDLLPNASVAQKIATGFHRNTPTNRENGIDKEEFRLKDIVDRVATTGTVWLGLTLGCAECHSHKYDPISQREYYRFFAFFNDRSDDLDLPVPPSSFEEKTFQAARIRHSRTLEKLKRKLQQAAPDKKEAVRKELAGCTKAAPKEEAFAYTIARRATPRTTRIHIGGNFLQKGAAVSPGVPRVLPPLHVSPNKAPDRLDLARWLVSPNNPLTPRVEVNRIWQHLFGDGLVSTPDDFGVKGSLPSHPELLDWLADEFMRRGWSRKEMIRLIVNSATYRQASTYRADLASIDPRNHLLARQNRFRLEAEIVRDQYLAASGLLNRQVGGPGFRPPLPREVTATGYKFFWPTDQGSQLYRRGMYIFFQRNLAYPMLMTFDHPDGIVSCPRRERANTPLQALTQLNHAILVECAASLAKRMLQETGGDDARITATFRRCLQRPPNVQEASVVSDLLNAFRTIYRNDAKTTRLLAGDGSAETAAWIALARTIMNLDEFVTRE